MKILFDAPVKRVSGKLGNLVYSSFNKVVDITGEQSVSGVVRRFVPNTKQNIATKNINKAFSLLSSAWKNASSNEKNEWDEDAARVSRKSDVLRSGRSHFIGYFMSLYNAKLTSYVRPASISFTRGKSFINKRDVNWAA